MFWMFGVFGTICKISKIIIFSSTNPFHRQPVQLRLTFLELWLVTASFKAEGARLMPQHARLMKNATAVNCKHKRPMQVKKLVLGKAVGKLTKRGEPTHPPSRFERKVAFRL
jgi:hypothetical protein